MQIETVQNLWKCQKTPHNTISTQQWWVETNNGNMAKVLKPQPQRPSLFAPLIRKKQTSCFKRTDWIAGKLVFMFFDTCILDFECHTDAILSLPLSVSPGCATEQHPWSALLKDPSAPAGSNMSNNTKRQREKRNQAHVRVSMWTRGRLGSRF